MEPDLLHEGDVFGVAMVVIARHLAGMAVPDGLVLLAEHVPNREPFAILVGGSLDLVRSGGGTPNEIQEKSCEWART